MGPRRQVRDQATPLLLLCLLLGGSSRVGATPPWSTGGWLTAAGGRESDLTLDSSPQPAIVPGGPFLALIAGANTRTGYIRRTHLDLAGQGWYERFTEADQRTLVSSTLTADLHLAMGRNWALRLGGGGHYFDDTARPTNRLTAGWGEAGLVWLPGPWRLEVQGGAEERRYPRIAMADGSGPYTETQTNVGSHMSLRVGRRMSVRIAGHRRWTDALDPLYTSEGPTFEAGAELILAAGVHLMLDGFFQERNFSDRPTGLDRDRYGQVGAGLDLELGPSWLARVTATASRYTWPDGQVVDTNRVQLALTLLLGSASRRGLPAPGRLPRYEAPDVPRVGQPVVFRVLLPEAVVVGLVGDFNGWGRDARPMRRTADGWWETSLDLPAGTHAYAYVADGVWLTPPEAAATEADGFGGRNGLLVVLP